MKVKFDGDVIYDVDRSWAAGGITLSSAELTTDIKKKSIDPGKTRLFTLEFQNNASTDQSTYIVNATFGSDCSVVFVPSETPVGGNFCATAPGSGRAKDTDDDVLGCKRWGQHQL